MISVKDLIIWLANGEPVPKKIKIWNNEYEYRKGAHTETLEYYHIGTGISLNKTISFNKKDLNQEVIILEGDEFEDIEEMNFTYGCDTENKIEVNFERHKSYINSLIKNQKKIIERLRNGTMD